MEINASLHDASQKHITIQKTGKVLKSNTLIFRQAKPVTQNQKTHNLTCYSPRLIKMIMEEVYITPSTIGSRLLIVFFSIDPIVEGVK